MEIHPISCAIVALWLIIGILHHGDLCRVEEETPPAEEEPAE